MMKKGDKKSPSQTEDLKKKLKEYQKEREEYLAGWQRSRADFINFKREEGERFKKIFELEKTEMILKILPVLDSLEKAKRELSASKELSNYLEGLNQIEKQFQGFLQKEGVEEIKCLDEKFNPNFHQAVEEIEVKDKKSGEILEVIQKGYRLVGRVIRPVRVKVAK